MNRLLHSQFYPTRFLLIEDITQNLRSIRQIHTTYSRRVNNLVAYVHIQLTVPAFSSVYSYASITDYHTPNCPAPWLVCSHLTALMGPIPEHHFRVLVRARAVFRRSVARSLASWFTYSPDLRRRAVKLEEFAHKNVFNPLTCRLYAIARINHRLLYCFLIYYTVLRYHGLTR